MSVASIKLRFEAPKTQTDGATPCKALGKSPAKEASNGKKSFPSSLEASSISPSVLSKTQTPAKVASLAVPNGKVRSHSAGGISVSVPAASPAPAVSPSSPGIPLVVVSPVGVGVSVSPRVPSPIDLSKISSPARVDLPAITEEDILREKINIALEILLIDEDTLLLFLDENTKEFVRSKAKDTPLKAHPKQEEKQDKLKVPEGGRPRSVSATRQRNLSSVSLPIVLPERSHELADGLGGIEGLRRERSATILAVAAEKARSIVSEAASKLKQERLEEEDLSRREYLIRTPLILETTQLQILREKLEACLILIGSEGFINSLLCEKTKAHLKSRGESVYKIDGYETIDHVRIKQAEKIQENFSKAIEHSKGQRALKEQAIQKKEQEQAVWFEVQRNRVSSVTKV